MCPSCFEESRSWRLWRFDLESDALIASHVIICCSGFHPLCDGALCSFSPGLRAFRRRSDKDQQPSADTAFNSCVAAQPLLSALTASYLDLYHFSFSLFQHATDFSCSVAIRLCCIRTSIRVTHTCLVSCSISSLRICMCFSPLLCGKCCHSSLLNDRKVSITHCVRLQSPDTPLGGALTCTCLHSPQGPCESLVMTGLILTEEWNKDEDDCTTDDCLI